MLKLLHTSDFHLGAKFGFLGQKARQHRQLLFQSFESLVTKAVEKKTDLVVIAGDIFDHSYPDTTQIGALKSQFDRLMQSNIHVVILPGNHDRLEEGTVWENFSEGEFLHVLNLKSGMGKKISDGNFVQLDIPDLKLHVLARPNLQQKSKKSPLESISKEVTKLRAEFSGDYVIAMAHGSVSLVNEAENYPISKDEIASLGADYLALGDWHGQLDVSQGEQVAWYSGSPEFTNMGQDNFGSCLIVELETGARAKVTTERLSELVYEKLDLNVEQIGQEKVKEEIGNKAGTKKVLAVTLTGELQLDKELPTKENLQDELADKFYFLKIDNKTTQSLDFKKLGAFPENSIPQQFLGLVEQAVEKGDLPKELAADVTNLGLRTILQGK